MSNQHTVKLQEDNQGRKNVTVPIQFARMKDWKKGDELEWEVTDDGDLLLKD